MQKVIFETIAFQTARRSQIIAPTQYGKSLTVAMAVIVRSIVAGERFTILAPSEKKAQIIMSYVIEHCFDNSFFTQQMELDPNEKLDRLRRQRSRDNITFKTGGGVKTLSLDAKNGKRNIEAAMGFGGNRLILDESSLIEDTLYATVKRMLGGYQDDDQFLLEIGNPFYRNHFYRTWHSDRYNKTFIDYHTGIKEGRYSQQFIDEMREEALFDVFYGCEFPDEDEVDSKGYRTLVPMDMLEKSYTTESPDMKNKPRLGVDVGGGGDYNIYTLRNTEHAWVEGKNQSNDTMTNVVEVENIIQRYGLDPNEHVYIDDTGIGRGVTDRLKEKGYNVNAVAVGAKPQDETKYKNIKAEINWGMRLWLQAGGNLIKNENWKQLNWLKYKVSTDKVIQMEPKEELKKRTGKSPDYADALALTFAQREEPLYFNTG